MIVQDQKQGHSNNLSVNFPDSMRGTYHSEIQDSNEKTKKDSFLHSRMSNQDFNKTTNLSNFRSTITPAYGTKYSIRELNKLNTIYNSRNTKSISGGVNEVTTGTLIL